MFDGDGVVPLIKPNTLGDSEGIVLFVMLGELDADGNNVPFIDENDEGIEVGALDIDGSSEDAPAEGMSVPIISIVGTKVVPPDEGIPLGT